MKIAVVTLFPAMLAPLIGWGITGRARELGLFDLATVDPRDFARDAHGTVDDRPYGGGPGMVLKVEPFAEAVTVARSLVPPGSPVLFLSPQGRRFDQATARRLAAEPGLILVAGRYEGFDERLIELVCDEPISIGDYILSGGEVAAMAVIDSVVRLLPGALGDEQSATEDSFESGLLDHPQYTRPEQVAGREVPPVLLTGNHAAIRRWRRKQALGRTQRWRPDLLARMELSAQDQELLAEYLAEQRNAGDTRSPRSSRD